MILGIFMGWLQAVVAGFIVATNGMTGILDDGGTWVSGGAYGYFI